MASPKKQDLPACPHCGSAEVTDKPRGFWRRIVPGATAYFCTACSKRFSAKGGGPATPVAAPTPKKAKPASAPPASRSGPAAATPDSTDAQGAFDEVQSALTKLDERIADLRQRMDQSVAELAELGTNVPADDANASGAEPVPVPSANKAAGNGAKSSAKKTDGRGGRKRRRKN